MQSLYKFVIEVPVERAKRQDIERYLNSIPPNDYGLGNRHAIYRAIKAFCNWLEIEYNTENPAKYLQSPILSKPILPSLEKTQVMHLIEQATCIRDKAVIALFAESGLRLSELANIQPGNINWDLGTIKVMGKGRKEAYAPFGELSKRYLREWLAQYEPDGNIWGLNPWGITSMLRRLEAETGLPCNPHTFRRTFACLLRKAGVDTMTIRDLGRWESIQMVERYTRSVTFQDSLKFYQGPLS